MLDARGESGAGPRKRPITIPIFLPAISPHQHEIAITILLTSSCTQKLFCILCPGRMDPLSIIASVLAIVTAGLQSTRSLKAAIHRYKTRDMTLLRLLAEVKDIENILQSLAQLLDATNQQPAVAAETSMTELLCGPIERCTQLCGD